MSLGHTAPFFSLWHIVLYCIVSVHLYSASCSAHQPEALPRDVNKDLTPKDQDKDKDLNTQPKELTPKDQDKDKDLLDLTPQGQGPDPQGPGQGQGLEICP